MIELGKFFEDASLIFLRNADARIGHGKGDRAPVCRQRCGHTHLSPLGEFDRIRNEIPEDLGHLAFVGPHERNPHRLVEDEIHDVRDQEWPQHTAQGAEEIHHLELGSLDSDFARLNLGQIQQVIDEFQQVLSALADIVDLLGLLAVELPVGVLEQQVRQGEDRIHRRSEFMAHVGEEARFHFVRAP